MVQLRWRNLRWWGGLLVVALWGCAEPPAGNSAQPRSGEQVYQRACAACHVPGRSGAPRSVEDFRSHWLLRLEQVGYDGLLAITEQGQRRMPPRGNCFDCSDQELSRALTHMLRVSGVADHELNDGAPDKPGEGRPDA